MPSVNSGSLTSTPCIRNDMSATPRNDATVGGWVPDVQHCPRRDIYDSIHPRFKFWSPTLPTVDVNVMATRNVRTGGVQRSDGSWRCGRVPQRGTLTILTTSNQRGEVLQVSSDEACYSRTRRTSLRSVPSRCYTFHGGFSMTIAVPVR